VCTFEQHCETGDINIDRNSLARAKAEHFSGYYAAIPTVSITGFAICLPVCLAWAANFQIKISRKIKIAVNVSQGQSKAAFTQTRVRVRVRVSAYSS